jgi:hypothetical protein
MRKPDSVATLTEFGRARLSKSFFMRDFLFSDIAAVHGLSNVPDDPDLAIAAGSRGRVRQGGVISAVAVGHRQAALAVMCRG